MNKKSSTNDSKLTNNESLFLKSNMIFKPKKYINLKPSGFKIYTFNAGLKKKQDDLLIILFDKISNTYAVYSKTSTPSAPIIWDKKYIKGRVKALIVNAGNANAHTGSKGIKIINKYVSYLSKFIGCHKNEIFVSSTGVIGEFFNPQLIIKQISKIKSFKDKSLLSAAKSIMTTDTYPKTALRNIKIKSHSFKIYGIAKGSGMIHPNMGTMLAYIFIEASLSKVLLKKLVNNNLDYSFNSISVDGDTSTSDTLAIFSVKTSKINFNIKKNFNILNDALADLMKDLSMQVIKDGEGLSKLIKVKVIQSKSINQAKKIGFSIVNSPLVKTAIAAEDANWGRIIMAIGKSQEKINQNKISVSFGDNVLCQKGMINKNININKINRYMKKNVIEIIVNLKNGKKDFTVYGNDLTNQYLKINGDYRS